MMELDCVRHSGTLSWDRTAGKLRLIDSRQHRGVFFLGGGAAFGLLVIL